MSDQGFHELQLSGKQLVFLFMSAIILLVVTFLLGVNVGRGVRGAVGDTEVATQADASTTKASDETAPDTDAAKPSQPELSYHDMLLGTTPQGEKTPAATPTPSLPGAEPPAPVSEPVPTQTPVFTPAPTPTPAARQSSAAPPKGSASDWFLQTGAYSTRAVADGQVAELKKLNVPAFVAPPEPGAVVKLFRVRIGPYSERAEAEQVKGRISRQGFSSSITR